MKKADFRLMLNESFEQFGETAVIGGRRMLVHDKDRDAFHKILVCKEKPSVGAIVEFKGRIGRVNEVRVVGLVFEMEVREVNIGEPR